MDLGEAVAALLSHEWNFKPGPDAYRLNLPTDLVGEEAQMRPDETKPLLGPGLLYLRFDQQNLRMRAEAALLALDLPTASDGDVLTICAPEADLLPLAKKLASLLNPLEQDSVRVIYQPLAKPLSLRDCFDIETLQQFLARAQSGWFLSLLRDGRITTHFQPIVSVADPNQVFAYEGLMRGCCTDGLIAPDKLFQVARSLKMNRELDSCARQATIYNAARHNLSSKIFVNCSPTSLDDPDETLHQTLTSVDQYGLSPEQIVFEITESECIPDLQSFRKALERYRNAGFKVALDDLGAGYSSLRMLGELRPDYVKLDRELVQGVDHDEIRAIIACKVLETAKSLNIRTVAEGVETHGEWEWLRENGGDLAQGFYFARPACPPPRFSGNGMFWFSPPAFAA